MTKFRFYPHVDNGNETDKTTSGSVFRPRSWKIPYDGLWRYLYDIWQPLTLLTITTSATYALFITYEPDASLSEGVFFCNVDGRVEKTVSGYTPLWDPQLYFTVNIAFGEFSFSNVKILDACWDLMVGRGGQMVAALMTYRVLRRSLTLVMEDCTVEISAIASIYCQQVQLLSIWLLAHNIVWHWRTNDERGKQSTRSGTVRLVAQIFACSYVILFASMASVMTGYRARFVGYFGYGPEQGSELQPMNRLSVPKMVLLDGSRIGLPDDPQKASDAIFFPEGNPFDITNFINSSRQFEEPYGLLVDYYFTCFGAYTWAIESETPIASSLTCTANNCSCATPHPPVSRHAGEYEKLKAFDSMTSTMYLDGKFVQLAAPPLSISLAITQPHDTRGTTSNAGNQNASVFLANYTSEAMRQGLTSVNVNGSTVNSSTADMYMNNNLLFNQSYIEKTGRCVAEDTGYSWGFSSLLLLTFCIYTILFASTLILLQTDVYWNSRFDHDHQSHSIYTDVIFLAKELESAYGTALEDSLKPPKALSQRVNKGNQGSRLKVDGLLQSRWQMWKFYHGFVSLLTVTDDLSKGPDPPSSIGDSQDTAFLAH